MSSSHSTAQLTSSIKQLEGAAQTKYVVFHVLHDNFVFENKRAYEIDYDFWYMPVPVMTLAFNRELFYFLVKQLNSRITFTAYVLMLMKFST